MPEADFFRHTLAEQLEQATILTEDTGAQPKQVVVDLGFRGVDADNPGVQIIHRGKFKSLTAQQRRWLKRRQAVEPAIGHLKHDNAMDRCWLQGATGDALHAVLCAAGYNIRWLLRAIVRLGLKGLFTPVFALLATLATALATVTGARKTAGGRRGGQSGEFCRADFNSREDMQQTYVTRRRCWRNCRVRSMTSSPMRVMARLPYRGARLLRLRQPAGGA